MLLNATSQPGHVSLVFGETTYHGIRREYRDPPRSLRKIKPAVDQHRIVSSYEYICTGLQKFKSREQLSSQSSGLSDSGYSSGGRSVVSSVSSAADDLPFLQDRAPVVDPDFPSRLRHQSAAPTRDQSAITGNSNPDQVLKCLASRSCGDSHSNGQQIQGKDQNTDVLGCGTQQDVRGIPNSSAPPKERHGLDDEQVRSDSTASPVSPTPSRLRLDDIESKLDKLAALVSDCGTGQDSGDKSYSHRQTRLFSWLPTVKDEMPSDVSSCYSATSSRVLSLSSDYSNGSETSTWGMGSSGDTSPFRSSNSQSSSQTSTSKRLNSQEGSGEPNEENRKTSKHLLSTLPPDDEGATETQIPCFVDNCPGKDKHISEMM